MHRLALCDGDRFVRRLAPPQQTPLATDGLRHFSELRLAARRFKSEVQALSPGTAPLRCVLEPRAIKILDAPGLHDDFYSQPLSWSSSNWLAVALDADVWAYDCSAGSRAEPHRCNAEARKLIGWQLDRDEVAPSVVAVQWSSDGRQLACATGGRRGSLALIELATKQTCFSFAKSKFSSFQSLSWSHEALACGGDQGEVSLLDTRQGKAVNSFRSSNCRISGVHWSPSCKLLAVGSNDDSVKVWDSRKTDRALHNFLHSNSAVKALAWASDASLFTGGGKTDGCVRKYSCHRGDLLATGVARAQITSLSYNSELRELVSTHRLGGGAIAKWSAADASLVRAWPQPGQIVGAALSPCGRQLAAASALELVSLWQVWPEAGNCKRLSYVQRLRQRSAIR